jgi:hypothetical protein
MEALFYGVLIKLYDEIIDMKLDLLKEEWMKRSTEYIIVVLQYLLMVNDFNFSIVYYLSNLIQALLFPESYISGPYETSLLILSVIPVVLSFPTYVPFDLISFGFGLLVILFFSVEPLFFPEEASLNKIVCRLGIANMYSFMLLTNMTASTPWITKLITIGLGYLYTSVIFQILKLHETLSVSSASSIGTASSLDLKGHVSKVLGDSTLKDKERNSKSENP